MQRAAPVCAVFAMVAVMMRSSVTGAVLGVVMAEMICNRGREILRTRQGRRYDARQLGDHEQRDQNRDKARYRP